jgi:hypothetical protein
MNDRKICIGAGRSIVGMGAVSGASTARFVGNVRRWLNGGSSMASLLVWIVKGRVDGRKAPHKRQAQGCPALLPEFSVLYLSRTFARNAC